jgi:Flp pilus assembly pilin Flp
MSDLITTTQDTYRNACIDAWFGVLAYAESLGERAKENKGQTAAEYMGILLIVSLVIAAVVKTDIAKTISERVGAIVDAIAHGKDA